MKESGGRASGNRDREIREGGRDKRIKDVENKWTEKASVRSCIDAGKQGGYDKHCV